MTIIIIITILLLLVLAFFIVKMTKEKYTSVRERENYSVDISAGIPPECDCHYNFVGNDPDPVLWTYRNVHPTDYEVGM